MKWDLCAFVYTLIEMTSGQISLPVNSINLLREILVPTSANLKANYIWILISISVLICVSLIGTISNVLEHVPK
mgnify:CR=1 FL=1